LKLSYIFDFGYSNVKDCSSIYLDYYSTSGVKALEVFCFYGGIKILRLNLPALELVFLFAKIANI
jgi:hypothetical protein